MLKYQLESGGKTEWKGLTSTRTRERGSWGRRFQRGDKAMLKSIMGCSVDGK